MSVAVYTLVDTSKLDTSKLDTYSCFESDLVCEKYLSCVYIFNHRKALAKL